MPETLAPSATRPLPLASTGSVWAPWSCIARDTVADPQVGVAALMITTVHHAERDLKWRFVTRTQ